MSMSQKQFTNNDGSNDTKASIAFFFIIVLLVVLYSLIY